MSTQETSLLYNQSSQPELLSPPMLSDSSYLSRIVSLEEKMKELCNTVTLLQNKNFILEKLVTNLSKKNEENNQYIINQDIYSRRNNIEICNVPESVENLENYVLKLLKSIGLDIRSYDLVAVHRMGRRTHTSRNVIVRFLNRKDAFSAIKLRYKLNSIPQYKKVFVTENLCPTNKKIYNALYKLKKSKIIHAVWSYNGCIFYRVDEEDDYQQAYQLDDVQYLFDEPNEEGNIDRDNSGTDRNNITNSSS